MSQIATTHYIRNHIHSSFPNWGSQWEQWCPTVGEIRQHSGFSVTDVAGVGYTENQCVQQQHVRYTPPTPQETHHTLFVVSNQTRNNDFSAMVTVGIDDGNGWHTFSPVYVYADMWNPAYTQNWMTTPMGRLNAIRIIINISRGILQQAVFFYDSNPVRLNTWQTTQTIENIGFGEGSHRFYELNLEVDGAIFD